MDSEGPDSVKVEARPEGVRAAMAMRESTWGPRNCSCRSACSIWRGSVLQCHADGRHAHAERIATTPEIRLGKIGPDRGGVFRGSTAIFCIGREGRLALIPQQFSSVSAAAFSRRGVTPPISRRWQCVVSQRS